MKPKGTKVMKEDTDSQRLRAEADAFIEKYRVRGGNCYDAKTRKVILPVKWGSTPESCLMVRELEKDGVKLLMQSFLGGVHTMELIAIMWNDVPFKSIALSDLDDIQFDTSLPEPPRPIQMIDGNHRTHGLQGCHIQYPKKALYAKLPVILLIIPKTRLSIQTCLYIGNSNNKSTQVYVRTTQWQVVKQYRRQWEIIDQDKTLTPEERVKAFSSYKARTASQVPFEANTLHTFSALATVHRDVFALMSKIFAGDFKVNKDLKGQRTPEAMTHFVKMSGIPVKKLCAWLMRVIEGDWVTATFMKRCAIYTKQVRVSGQILEHIGILRPKYAFQEMDAVAKVFPKVQDSEWFDTVVSSCEDAVKSKLSVHAIKLIEDMVEMSEKLANDPKVFLVF